MIKFYHGDKMKKMIFILLLIIPTRIQAIDYKINKDNYTLHFTDNINIVNNNEIIIIDQRLHSNNIEIKNSYKINNHNIQKDIINEILEYNKKYPANNWIRSSNSMYLEWNFHNILYKLNLFKSHTISVDFEVKEEIKYNLVIFYLQKIINML